ncbi:winged helix-turn-helix domain-containing protein [Chelatococcus reniformis]|uniref:OmpR/PhoB-type domain-containing protein n=1 Tax=Chelatococcus reniformis TaxID=1494448 RepID=A0A916UXU6_9HYPH|nr:winged helix-turn-helix domain-containing protein [Chelatococcus reniformis]GGC90587.1 hypothetical protein GCM10010994_55490 [Chelatococcus reniformis]
MLSPDRTLADLREENEELREQVRQLQEMLAPRLPIPIEWRLTVSERRFVEALYRRDVCARDLLFGVVCGAVETTGQVIDVHACRIRKKVRPFGIDKAIVNVRGIGFAMGADLRRAIEAASGVAA